MHRRILIGSIGSIFALAVGCSDDPATTPDASTTDVITTTDNPATDLGTTTDVGFSDAGPRDVPVATDIVDAGAPDVPATDGGGACALTRALVTTSDYVMGGYAFGPITPPSLTVSGTMSPDQDHGPVQSGCIVYNLLRDNDVIAVLNPTALPTVSRRIPLRMMAVTGADAGTPAVDAGPPRSYQANPYDVLTLSPTRALVVQYAVPRIGIINPSLDGAAGVTGSIDLTPLRPFADTDSSPEANAIVQVGERIFVSMQNLDNYVPVVNGTVAVLNASDLTLVDANPADTGLQALRLTGRNPVAMVTTPTAASIVVAEAGVIAFAAPQTLDGRIERINPTTLSALGAGVTEMTLGGDVSGVVMLDETRGWAVVGRLAMGDAGVNDNRVVEFDLNAGTAGRTIFTTSSIGGIARDPSGNVWVLDRSAGRSGVHVFRPDGTAITTMAITAGAQPPNGIAFVP